MFDYSNFTDEAQLLSQSVCATYLLARIFLERIQKSFSKLQRKSFQKELPESFVNLLCIISNEAAILLFQILRQSVYQGMMFYVCFNFL